VGVGRSSAPPRASTTPLGRGKEEVRASILKPYLLRLRSTRDEATVRTLLSTIGIPVDVLDDETSWISVAAAQRALGALEFALGEDALRHRGDWMTHPENLGTYVRLLRAAAEPMDAYRWLAQNAGESTRIGAWELVEVSPESARMIYTPRADAESPQDDAVLCRARDGELIGLPRLWGLGEAESRKKSCLANGDASCTYELRWPPLRTQSVMLPLAAAGALGSAATVALAGSWTAALAAVAVGGGLGGAIGRLADVMRNERPRRAFEKNRIAALERGLELKGESHAQVGDLTGAILGGKYRILHKVGTGGIGTVYAAEHVALGSQVAIKVLRGAAAGDGSEIARLRREAQVQVMIEHPNVVRTLDLDQLPDGSIYVVMELLRGRTLADKLAAEGPVAPGFGVPVFIQVCRALAAAHAKKIIHRDLKPGNIFLGDDGFVKVLDFGMSKFSAAEQLTQEGYTLGTPEYMAPEQCIGAPVEPRTDLYAFGVLMYEALTGELPIVAQNRRDLLDLHQRQVPLRMRERRTDLPIPDELDEAVMRTLRKRVDDRPRDAQELEQMLADIPREKLVASYPPLAFTGTDARG
jgi:serine/threonine-protein kinase